MQNPRPTNANGGGQDYPCYATLNPPIGDPSIFIDIIDNAPTHTLPSDMPDMYIAVAIRLNNGFYNQIYLSDPFNTFSSTEYTCYVGEVQEEPVDIYYVATPQLDVEVLSELFAEYIVCQYGMDGSTSTLDYYIKYSLVTFNEQEQQIPYPTTSYPDYFDCVGHTTYFIESGKLCCLSDEDPSDGGGNGNDGKDSKGFKGGNDSSESRTINFTDQKTALSPNPFSNTLFVRLDVRNLQIYNSNGSLVQSVLSPENLINTSTLEEGMYLIRYHNGVQWKTEKFIKID